MSTETAGVDTAERARYIRTAYAQHGRPPSEKMVGEASPYGHSYYHSRSSLNWDDILRTAGVPGHDDVVADALRELWDDRYPWQDFLIVRSKQLVDVVGLNASQIGRTMMKFADGERSHDALAGLVVSRNETGSSHMKWRVEER